VSAATSAELELAARLRLSVTRLARRLRQQSDGGLTPSQISALSSIERHGSVTPSVLASIERIQRPTATRLIGTLAAAGLITREADPTDGRIARVRVTREGATVLRRGRSRKNAYLARRLQRLDPGELEILEQAAELLERLYEEDREPRQ
jgi:DNA-binding MarR family transcriptional regulator